VPVPRVPRPGAPSRSELHRQMNLLLSRLDEQQRRGTPPSRVKARTRRRPGRRPHHRDARRHDPQGREELAASLEGRPPIGSGSPAGPARPRKKSPRSSDPPEARRPADRRRPDGEAKFVRRSSPPRTELADHGSPACPTTVARLLRERATRPDQRQAVHRAGPPERDRQFRNIQDWIEIFRELGQPVISVEARRRADRQLPERRGGLVRRARGGQRLRLHRRRRVRATPYGIYDVTAGRGISTSAPRRTPRRSPSRRSGRGGPATAASDTGGGRVADPSRRRRQQRHRPGSGRRPSRSGSPTATACT